MNIEDLNKKFHALNEKKMHMITGGESGDDGSNTSIPGGDSEAVITPCQSVCDCTIVSTCCVYIYIPPTKPTKPPKPKK